MFRNSNLVVTGGHFTNIDNAGINDAVSTVLWPHVASGAIFDSAERYPPGKCHPGTREKMIQRIMNWIDDPDPAHRILWVYGLAGSGKSALAHTICELMRQTDGDKCVGSFFFVRGPTDRGKGLKLFATLAYQLAVQFPSVRAEINETLYRDPSLPTKSMDIQLLSLIIQPLLQCRSFPSHSPTLIIDGLDECADDQGMDTQRTIITLISQSIVKYNIPLRFIISCRPESWIRDTFEASPLPNITLSLSLRDDENVDEDIRAYLVDGFEKIRVEKLRIMGRVVPPWPSPNIVERFVYEASGQYIYASTLLKFVGQSSRFSDPQEQLRILISPGPERALAFSELDRLYERIISVFPRWATMKRVLGGILLGANQMIIEHILGVDRTQIMLVLDALSPLINVKIPRPPSQNEVLFLEPIFGTLSTGHDEISLCHLSFREFLEDETRSGVFHIDIRSDLIKEISSAPFDIVHRNLDQNYATEPHRLLNIGLAAYQRMISTLAWRMIQNSDVNTLLPLIICMTLRLRVLDPDLQMRYVGCFMQDMDWIENLLCVAFHTFSSTSTVPPSHQPWNAEHKQFQTFMQTKSELEDVIYLLRRRRIRLLSSSTTFTVTPTLAYLNEDFRVAFDELFTMPWLTIPDILSTFYQHCHIINISYNHLRGSWDVNLINLNENFNVTKDWRSRGEWRRQRISLILQILKMTLNNGYGRNKRIQDRFSVFFASQNLSDIRNRKYFENSCNLSLLTLLTNLSSWANLLPIQPETWYDLGSFIMFVLCWFNRQLTRSTTLNLLEDYNKDLVPRMRTAMDELFEHLFLPNYRRFYHSELFISTRSENDAKMLFETIDSIPTRSIKIRALALPQGYYEEEIPYVRHVDLRFCFWRPFHDEVFRKAEEGSSTIDPQRWHPYLAACLLNSLAKDLYRNTNTAFKLHTNRRVGEQFKESFEYIVQCLPYAGTTQQNLDSLRAIVYLFPKANLSWDPPEEFWSLSVDFLKKFDRSILSEEELKLFEQWMADMSRDPGRYRKVT